MMYRPCGSQLAGDGFSSILQIQPVACIAGKPAPTMVYGPCGSQLAGDGFGSILQIQPVPASLASQLPQWFKCQVRALWEPACWRWLRLNPADTAGCLHRWQASPLKLVSQVGLCRALYGFAYGQIPHQQPVVQIHLLRNRQVYGVAVTRCHLNRQPGAVV